MFYPKIILGIYAFLYLDMRKITPIRYPDIYLLQLLQVVCKLVNLPLIKDYGYNLKAFVFLLLCCLRYCFYQLSRSSPSKLIDF